MKCRHAWLSFMSVPPYLAHSQDCWHLQLRKWMELAASQVGVGTYNNVNKSERCLILV
jgi:hypothetical protein